MKHFLGAPALFCLVGCSTAVPNQGEPVAEQNPSGFLIQASATDFYQHTGKSIRFRGVRLGYELNSESVKQFLMCGEFMPLDAGSNGTWSRFATIKTEPYEQWLGAQASGMCDRTSIVWEDQEDLSGRLQNAFDALR